MLQWTLVAWLVGTGGFFLLVWPTSAQDDRTRTQVEDLRTNVAVNTLNIETLKSEVVLIRALNIDSRLSSLEDTVVEVKWLGRTAASVLLGQLVLAIMANRKKTR